jgi:hypothetical protein
MKSKRIKSKRRRVTRKRHTHPYEAPRWNTYTLHEFLMVTKEIHGAGNFINPLRSSDCYEPLSSSNFKFWSGISMQQLKLVLTDFVQSGTSNKVFAAEGISSCRDNDKDLVIRVGYKPLQLKSRNDAAKLNAYRDEMKMFASLRGIVPNLYMCGILNSEEYPGAAFPFAIMDRYAISVHDFLRDNNSNANDWNIVISHAMSLYDSLGNMGICNVDVKPMNMVCSRTPIGWDVKLIDIDPGFNIRLRPEKYGHQNVNVIYGMIMKYLFLQHVAVHYRVPFLRQWSLNDGKIVQGFLEKELKSSPLYTLFLSAMLDQIASNSRLYHSALKHYKLPFNQEEAYRIVNQQQRFVAPRKQPKPMIPIPATMPISKDKVTPPIVAPPRVEPVPPPLPPPPAPVMAALPSPPPTIVAVPPPMPPPVAQDPPRVVEPTPPEPLGRPIRMKAIKAINPTPGTMFARIRNMLNRTRKVDSRPILKAVRV